MPTINELLGPVASSPSIVDLLGPEPPSTLFKQPEPIPTSDEFLDSRTLWKTEGGRFQSTKQTPRERIIEERDDMVEQVTPEKLAGQLTVAPLAARGGLKQTLAGILRAVNAPPILTWLYSKSAEQDTIDAEEFSKMIGGGKAGKTVMEFGSTGIQSLPALAAAPAGLLGMAVTAGAQTFGSVTEDAYQTYKAKDDPEALNKARLAGGLAGVVTTGLTRYMPGGTERFAQALVKGDLSKLAAQGMVKTILKEAAADFPEEALDQVSQGVIAKFSYRPETTWQDIGEGAVKAGLMGSALAGLTGTVALPAAKGISRLRRGSAMRESISTDEPQSFGEPLVVTKEEPIQQAPQAAPIISGAPAAVAISEGNIAKAVEAPVSKFLADVESGSVSTTQAARDFGQTVKTQEGIAQLKQAYEAANQLGFKALGSATLKTMDAAIALAQKPQFINEAIEWATGASEFKGKDATRFQALMEAGQPRSNVTVVEEPPAPVTKPTTEGPPPPKKPTTTSAPPADELATTKLAENSSSLVSEQKYRIGRSPQTFSIIEELPATPIEVANNEQAVRVKNERTGEVTDVLKSQLVPVQAGIGVKVSRDLDAELTSRKLDPSVFPNAKAKRAAIERHDTLNKRTNRKLAEEIAGKLEGLKSGKKPGDLHLFGVVSLVWDTAITIAQKTFLATGSVADAVRDAINYIRANNKSPFDEAGASEFLGRSVEPTTDFVEPEPDEADGPSEGGYDVNIAGRTYPVISKDRLTPEQREAGDAAAQATFQSMGIPGVPDRAVDKRPGSIDNNTVWRVVPDGQNHDAEAEALRDHLIEQIQIQNSPEGDTSYVSSLINAINMNFDHGRWQDVISQPVLESLLNVSVGESSKRGTLLRQIRGISNDMRAIAQNAELRLKWVYQKTFDPDGLVTKILAKVREVAGENATIEQKKLVLIKILAGLTPQEKAKVNKTKIGRLI